MRLHEFGFARVIVTNLGESVTAYKALGAASPEYFCVGQNMALAWGKPELANRPGCRLGWLELIEWPDAVVTKPFTAAGWIALEVLVRDVDAMALILPPQFKVLQSPKDLDISDAIRAMQICGPAGEVLYLTQVKRAVPPFRLPLSEHMVSDFGHLFVAVLASRSRTESSAFYRGLGAGDTLQFEARLSALNAAHNLSLDQRHPVATVQLGGLSLIEFDQPDVPLVKALSNQAGILSVGIRRLGARGQAGHGRILRGPDNEQIELI
jgi:hypothetical protein